MNQVAQISREAIRKGSKSFAAAARLFDSETRASVYMLYAWCRYCDDEIDGQELGFAKDRLDSEQVRERLERIRRLTERALAGEAMDEPAFQGLQRVVARYDIRPRYPLELIDGFAMDADEYRFETLEDTLLYCYHVAGVVGIMMAQVMGVRDPDVLSRAADLGIAFQLTNIARDVMDDAHAARCYLPAVMLREAGVPPEEIADPAHRAGVSAVASRLLNLADRYYASAAEGVRALPLRAAWAICTARGVYRDIGRIVVAEGADAWRQRAVVSRSRKIYWIFAGGGRALVTAGFGRRRAFSPRADDLWIKPDIC